MVTLDTVRAASSPELYPRHVLPVCDTALVLFAAAWHGKQDAVWIADAGLTATCVDTDAERLGEMAAAYPDDWEFVEADVFGYAYRTERKWDLVSIDCPTNRFEECSVLLPLWGLIARKAIILGVGARTRITVPDGWMLTGRLHRSNFNGGVYWVVMESTS